MWGKPEASKNVSLIKLFYLDNNFTKQPNIDFCHWHLHKLLSFLGSLMRSSIDGRQGMIWLCKRWKFKKNVRFLVGYKWKSCLNTICRDCGELIDQADQANNQNNLNATGHILRHFCTCPFWHDNLLADKYWKVRANLEFLLFTYSL